MKFIKKKKQAKNVDLTDDFRSLKERIQEKIEKSKKSFDSKKSSAARSTSNQKREK